jgi:hypothetical protein
MLNDRQILAIKTIIRLVNGADNALHEGKAGDAVLILEAAHRIWVDDIAVPRVICEC